MDYETHAPTFSVSPTPKRFHNKCGSEVNFDDPREPKYFCPTCQDTVFTHDTHTDDKDNGSI